MKEPKKGRFVSEQSPDLAGCDAFNEDDGSALIVHAQMPPEAVFRKVTDLLKAAADPTRAKILYALARHELCVCELTKVVNMPISAVSHQLRMLRHLDLVAYRKQGRFAYYTIAHERLRDLLNELVAEAEESFAAKDRPAADSGVTP